MSKITKLKAYLQAKGLLQSQFAKDNGISEGYLSELVSGDKTPGLKVAFAIERATKGAVPAKSWLSESAAQ